MPPPLPGAAVAEQLTGPITASKHNTSSTTPGHYNVGSDAFVGGSDVKIIHPIL